MRKLIRKFICWAFPEIRESLSMMKDEYKAQAKMSDTLLKTVEEQYQACKQAQELSQQACNTIRTIMKDFELSVDVHPTKGSWAVISAIGQKKTLIKFIDLSDKDLREIVTFLRTFENVKIDAEPHIQKWMAVDNELF